MATQKKKKTVPAKKKTAGRNGGRQIAAILLFFLNILVAAFAAVPGVNVWRSIHDILLGISGFWIFPWLVFLGYIWAVMSLGKPQERNGLRLGGIGLVLLLAGTLIQLFHYGADYASFGEFITASYEGGISGAGVLGALLAYPFGTWFGRSGAILIVLLAVVVLVLLLTGTTLMQFLGAVSKPVQKISTDTKEAIQQRRVRRREEKEWDISLEGMPDEPTAPPENDPADIAAKSRRLVESYHDEKSFEELTPAEEAKQQPAPGADLNEIIQKAQDDAQTLRPGKESADKPAAKTKKDSGIQVEAEQEVAYRYPPVSLLEQNVGFSGQNLQDELKNNAELLVDTLRSFGVETRIINISRGPSVTRYELQPAAGVKISKITGLADDLALNLATAGVRIEAPIPNKAAVGIEVPNKDVASVLLRDIVDTPAFEQAKSKLTIAVGKDVTGNIITGDLAKMPHMLVAGTTGSGKSVCLHSFIVSVLFKASPDDVKMLMIDPKAVEFRVYNGLPHLLVPVVSDPRKASGALGWAVSEMEKRYKLFGDCKVRDLASYNAYAETHDGFEHLPQILIIADELADLMMTAPAEVEDSICRLAQKARAAGLHLVLATQRPSADVITGLIKANIPSRISLKVANAMESRIILDAQGGEKLLGKGDMLFYPVGIPKPIRVQGCWVSDQEIERVVNYIIGDSTNEYDEEVSAEIDRHAAETKGKKGASMAMPEGEGDEDADEMLDAAAAVVVEAGIASTSLLQRKLKLGYARAARIVDQLEERGIVGPFEGSKPRKVLISRQQFEEMRMNNSD